PSALNPTVGILNTENNTLLQNALLMATQIQWLNAKTLTADVRKNQTRLAPFQANYKSRFSIQTRECPLQKNSVPAFLDYPNYSQGGRYTPWHDQGVAFPKEQNLAPLGWIKNCPRS